VVRIFYGTEELYNSASIGTSIDTKTLIPPSYITPETANGGYVVRIALPGTDYLQLAEVQVWVNNENVAALYQAPTQSSNLQGFEEYSVYNASYLAASAVDGDRATRAITTSTFQPWWQVSLDISTPNSIEKIVIFYRADRFQYRLSQAIVTVSFEEVEVYREQLPVITQHADMDVGSPSLEFVIVPVVQSDQTSSDQTSLIAGAVVGGLAGLAMLAFAVFAVVKRKKQQPSPKPNQQAPRAILVPPQVDLEDVYENLPMATLVQQNSVCSAI
jgi:hypothetical protein